MNKTMIDDAAEDVLQTLRDWLEGIVMEGCENNAEWAKESIRSLTDFVDNIRIYVPLWIAIGHADNFLAALLHAQVHVERLGRYCGKEMQDNITSLSNDIDSLRIDFEEALDDHKKQFPKN